MKGSLLVLVSFAAMFVAREASAQVHTAFCREFVNPHGENIPPAGSTTLPGPNGGQNDDGFYIVGVIGQRDTDVLLVDDETGYVFGCFPDHTTLKYTEANGRDPGFEEMAGGSDSSDGVDYHLWGQGDLLVYKTTGDCQPILEPVTCYVPPPPK